MKTPDSGEFSPEEDTQQLRARVAKLEEEISRIRGGIEGPEGRVAEALEKSDLQYKKVFDNISACMFLIDVTPDGRFKYAGFNAAEEKAVGLTNAQVRGKFVEEVFAQDLAKKLNATYRRCLEAGVPMHYEDELDLPSGRRYFNSNLIPLRNGPADIHRIVGACIDTTDFKRTQEEALARQKLESIGVLAGGIAHDFNNLLGGILSQAELAEKELAAGSLPGQELQVIKNVAIRAGEMVRELMVYSGQDNPGSLDPVDLSGLVTEMLELLKISISKHATLTVDLPKNLPAVRANAVQLRQVVMNLITNASEALGDKNGVISLTTAKAESGQGTLADHQPDSMNGYLRLQVSDSGCGMTEDVLTKIFDPFFTTKLSGRGLGLASVQGIIRSHGGTISVASSPGQGSRFQILLPCIGESALDSSDVASPASVPDIGGATGTVLLVEDEEPLRLAVSKMLRKEKFFVIEAADGTTGASLFLANERQIDVVLLDLTLPGMSGQNVLEELQRIRPDVRVILTTAYSQDVAYSSIGKQHPWSYVRKPYRFSEVVTLLRMACLDKQQTRSKSAG
jgi:two-component system cell cycle sensor histidine kinase/response regulator CckA